MPTLLPATVITVLCAFAPLFSARVWDHAQVLLVGAILAPAQRTVEVVSATAVWYHCGLPPVPLRWVLIRDPQGHVATQALLCTDPAVSPAQILAWFVHRWQLEVTFEEARCHLGLETQRQGSAAAVRRTTPVLLGLFSLSRCWPTGRCRYPSVSSVTPLGITSASRPLPMRWRWSDATSGSTKLFPRRPALGRS